MPLSSPALLAANHELTGFASGEESLDEWLGRSALANQVSGASRTYVTCEGARAVGYYAISSGSVALASAPGRFRRNMPDPIPVVILARLAVSRAWQGHGIGRALVGDAAQRVSQAADVIGIRGIVVHAISDEARNFYVRIGFDECTGQPMTLVVTLTDLRAGLRINER